MIGGVDYVTLDQWVHLAAEVLGTDGATIDEQPT